ncbi:MAG: hypothetical protein CMJ59_06750 [Planctomycetaceae bacterium]|nr:hypothetical protein [Planctomycetaceae bacterium]
MVSMLGRCEKPARAIGYRFSRSLGFVFKERKMTIVDFRGSTHLPQSACTTLAVLPDNSLRDHFSWPRVCSRHNG